MLITNKIDTALVLAKNDINLKIKDMDYILRQISPNNNEEKTIHKLELAYAMIREIAFVPYFYKLKLLKYE